MWIIILYSNQFNQAIAIGSGAGQNEQYSQAVAIGSSAGQNSQGSNSVAIGTSAGYSNQLPYCIACIGLHRLELTTDPSFLSCLLVEILAPL